MAMTNAQKFNQGGMPNQLASSVSSAIAGATAADAGIVALTPLTVTAPVVDVAGVNPVEPNEIDDTLTLPSFDAIV